ncbi:MAG: DUF1295 domain-containing protein [Caulobacterales bacterium]|nr:DUF1295 domain-containing protein [Caulobacterales bacterium]
MTDITTILAVNFAVIMACMIALWLISLRLNDVSFVDSFWATGFVVVAWCTFALLDAPDARDWLILALTTAWGARLGGYLFWRWRKEGPDARYVALMKRAGDKVRLETLTKVFLLQGVMLWVVALPIMLGQAAGDGAPLGALAYAGAGLALVGFVFESVGDWQMAKFKGDPANEGQVMDRGLWRFTRHPNYFGDACVFWGLYLIAAETGLGALSVIGPALLTWTLVKWSGAALLERRLKRSRPGYEDYVRRTSGFIPWPPKPLERESGAATS